MANLHRPPRGEHNSWLLSQIYLGGEIIEGISEYIVPNVNDIVRHFNETEELVHRVLSVDDDTDIAVLQEVSRSVALGGDPTYGVGSEVMDMGTASMLLINPLLPNIPAAIHTGLPLTGTDIGYGRLFIGNDISSKGDIVSLNLDINGDLVDDKILISRTVPNDVTNLNYTAAPFNIDRVLEEDSWCRLSLYSSAGINIGYYSLVVVHNHAISNLSDRVKFITDIELESTYINPLNSKELLVPRGALSSTFNPKVYRSYNDNTKSEIPITSSNLLIAGWGDYILGEAGETFPLIVSYILGTEERSDSVDMYNGTHLAVEYTVVVTDNDATSDYAVAHGLEWVDVNNGYVLKAWLYSNYYDTMVDITDHMSYNVPFEGLNYLEKQDFNYSVDLSVVDEVVSTTVVTGAMSIAIKGTPTQNDTAYLYYPHPLDEARYFGDNLHVKIHAANGTNTIEIDNGYLNLEEWLDNLFYKLAPVYDTTTVDNAPNPTHCDIIILGTTVTLEVQSEWNGGVLWTSPLPASDTMARLEWYYVDDTTTRHDLVATTLPVVQ